MASHRDQLREYIKTLFADGLPGTDVERNRTKSRAPSQRGSINVLEGDPGEPERRLSSSKSYFYEDDIPVEVEVLKGSSELTLDDLLGLIADLLMADSILGGLSGTIEVSAPSPATEDAVGTYGVLWTGFTIKATYATSHPFK